MLSIAGELLKEPVLRSNTCQNRLSEFTGKNKKDLGERRGNPPLAMLAACSSTPASLAAQDKRLGCAL